jgi:hypothetical protein
MDWITADLVEVLHHMSWFDGLAYIALGLGVYASVKYIQKRFK